MKQYQVNKAYDALGRIMSRQVPARDAYNLYMLAEKLKPNHTFAAEREQKLVEKHDGIFNSESGGFQFKDKSAVEAFCKEIEELNDMDVEIEFEPVKIALSSFGEQTIRPADIMNLNGFVAFV